MPHLRNDAFRSCGLAHKDTVAATSTTCWREQTGEADAAIGYAGVVDADGYTGKPQPMSIVYSRSRFTAQRAATSGRRSGAISIPMHLSSTSARCVPVSCRKCWVPKTDICHGTLHIGGSSRLSPIVAFAACYDSR